MAATDPVQHAIADGPVIPVTDSDFRLLVQAVGDYAIFLLDTEGRIRSWNAGARRLKGYEADEIIGRSFETFYPEDAIHRRFPQHELREAVRTGRFEDEGWRLRKDGSRFWASVVITALFDEDGTHRGFAKVTRDLTDRRANEEALHQSEERFRLMVDSVRDYAIFLLDADGHVASWNLGAQLTKGYLAEEVIGQHFSVFYPEDKRAEGWPERELDAARRDGRFEDEGWRVRKDGTRFWASVVITALYDEAGQPKGFAKITRDLTDRRRISDLEEQERHLTQFLAVLGHELRNPMTPIANAVTIMQLEEPSNPRIRTARDILARQVGHLRRLVDDLLDVGRIASGKVHLEARAVELRSLLGEAAESIRPEMKARGHSFEVATTPEELWVMGDRTRLVQVLTNLLHNAAKFTPPGGHVWLSLARKGDRAELAVRDNGPGIPPDQLPRMFTLFAQADGPISTRTHGGLGIGLSLVKQMVALHHGEIRAASSGVPGEGAEFVVSLPLIDPPAPERG